MEQCDNGNQLGCRNCLVESGWSCTAFVGHPSICTPKVVVPTCGNGIFEPSLGETCDDGNVNNGDGCSAWCKVEFGWVCPDYKHCTDLRYSPVRYYCGNGILEQQYGEQCDDGNTLNTDGCSSECKVETGWTCAGLRSVCTRQQHNNSGGSSAFCGNDRVEWNEECDDGFPLRNGDGCSILCKIEAGWQCYNLATDISRCWLKWSYLVVIFIYFAKYLKSLQENIDVYIPVQSKI